MNVPTSHNLDDQALATWLDGCCKAGQTVGYLYAQYLCKVFDLADPSTLHPADPDKKSRRILKKLARRGLLQHLELPLATLDAAHIVGPAWNLALATQDQIAELVDARLQSLGRSPGEGRISRRKPPGKCGRTLAAAACTRDVAKI